MLLDLVRLLRIGLQFHARLAAENLFLRKQLVLYVERKVKPRRASNATRITLVMLARAIDWRPVLTVVQPDTLIRWPTGSLQSRPAAFGARPSFPDPSSSLTVPVSGHQLAPAHRVTARAVLVVSTTSTDSKHSPRDFLPITPAITVAIAYRSCDQNGS